MGLLLLNSRGINTRTGSNMIRNKLYELGYRGFGEKRILCVSLPEYEVDEVIVKNLTEIIGFNRKNIYMSVDGIPDGVVPDIIYVTEGNTFEVLNYMRLHGLIDYIQKIFRVHHGTVYIGSSAGAMLAGTDILFAEDFDSNYLRIADYTALGLFDGTIIPHYEPEHLERYLVSTEGHIKERYRQILSVGNEEIIVMKT